MSVIFDGVFVSVYFEYFFVGKYDVVMIKYSVIVVFFVIVVGMKNVYYRIVVSINVGDFMVFVFLIIWVSSYVCSDYFMDRFDLESKFWYYFFDGNLCFLYRYLD